VRTLLPAIKRFVLRKDEGAALFEYVLLVTLIAIACVTVVTLLGSNLSSQFNNIVSFFP
jgi:Flp pilus assembly pilin Flp